MENNLQHKDKCLRPGIKDVPQNVACSSVDRLIKQCHPNLATSSSTQNPPSSFAAPQFIYLTKLLVEHLKNKKEELEQIILSPANISNIVSKMTEEFNPQQSATANNENINPNEANLRFVTSDEQIKASMIHLLNFAFSSAFGFKMFGDNTDAETSATAATKTGKPKNNQTPAAKKRRCYSMESTPICGNTNNKTNENESTSDNGSKQGIESKSTKGKTGRGVLCKATYTCTICDKPTSLNTSGSRWNLLRHVKLHHSDCKPYKCSDCDFTGTKDNVIKHAIVSQHQYTPVDLTTDAMNDEWEMTLRKCFPDYFRAKKRVYQAKSDAAPEVVPKVYIKSEAAPEFAPKLYIKSEAAPEVVPEVYIKSEAAPEVVPEVAIEVLPRPVLDINNIAMLHGLYYCLPFH